MGIRRGGCVDIGGDGTGKSGIVPVEELESVVGRLDPLECLSERPFWFASDVGLPSQYSGCCCSVNCARCEGSIIEGTKLGRGGL